MDTNVLSIASMVAFVIRFAAICIFIWLALIQYREIKSPRTIRPLARFLLNFFIVTILASLPLLWLNHLRIIGQMGSTDVTSVATVTNALGLLIAGIMILLIYLYKGGDDVS